MARRNVQLHLVAAGLIAVSGGVHLRLHREQYRDVHVERVLGIDLASSFVLAVLAATVIAVLLLASVTVGRGERLAAMLGVGYSAGAIAAYGFSRTIGLLGFEENRWIPEAVIVKPVELAAGVLLFVLLFGGRSPAVLASPSSPARPPSPRS